MNRLAKAQRGSLNLARRLTSPVGKRRRAKVGYFYFYNPKKCLVTCSG